jgi:hypothetical protein
MVAGLGSFVGKASMALSGVQMLTTAFQEGNTPLETTITLLSGLSMLLPIISGGFALYSTIAALATKNNVSFLTALAAKILGLKLEEMATWSNTAANLANLLSNPWTWAIAAIAIAAIAGVVIWIGSKTKATEQNT